MKKLFYFVILACISYACSSDSDFTPEDGTPSDIYELKAIPDKEVIFKTYPASMKQILGAGYDVTADYLSPEAIKAPIMDLEKLENSDEDKIYRMRAMLYRSVPFSSTKSSNLTTTILHNILLLPVNSYLRRNAGTFRSSITQRNINTDTLRRSLKMMLPV